MNGTAGTIVRVLIGLAALYLGYRLLVAVVGLVFSLIIPIAVIGGVYMLLTRTNAGRALIGGRRSLP